MSVTTESILSNQNETTKDTPKENEEKFDNKMEVDTQINSQNQLNDKDKPMRILINKESFSDLTKDDLVKKWKEQDVYIDSLEEKLKVELSNKEWYQDNEDKYKQQLFDLTRKENLLLMKLTTKEHEMQDYIKQIQELKLSQIASNDQLQSTFLDPAVNMIFEEMKKEVEKCKLKVEEMQNELSAWKFTPDSNTGKRLMAKCRLLYQENEELGKVISSGRIAKLEGELALQKSFSEEMKKSQGELDDFLFELEEDVEGMQSTIYHLQQQLKESKELLQKYKLKEEDDQSKDNSKTDSTEKASEELTNNKQNNESNNEENKDNDSVNDDNLNVKSNNELNGDKSNDNQTVEEKNNPERKRSLDEVLEEVNQSGTECGIDSILKKHRKIDQENENILKNS